MTFKKISISSCAGVTQLYWVLCLFDVGGKIRGQGKGLTTRPRMPRLRNEVAKTLYPWATVVSQARVTDCHSYTRISQTFVSCQAVKVTGFDVSIN